MEGIDGKKVYSYYRVAPLKREPHRISDVSSQPRVLRGRRILVAQQSFTSRGARSVVAQKEPSRSSSILGER